MLCVLVHGGDPGRVSDGLRLALYTTSSALLPSCSDGMWFVLLVPSFCRFCFVCLFLFFVLSLELCTINTVDIPIIFL